jgi:hypothetical protein
MDDLQFVGYKVVVKTGSSIHNEEYAHNKIGDIVDTIISTRFLFGLGIQKLTIQPKFRPKKKENPPPTGKGYKSVSEIVTAADIRKVDSHVRIGF